MGPRLFSHGYVKEYTGATEATAFQWGHDFSAMDTSDKTGNVTLVQKFQWGHDFSAMDTSEVDPAVVRIP